MPLTLKQHDLKYSSLSRNPIGDDGFSIILDALIKKPDALRKLGYYTKSLCTYIGFNMIYTCRIFGCEITSREMHKFVEFFKKTTAFTGMK